MSAQLDVVAVGARTPVGLTAASSAAAVRAGISRYAEYPFIDVRGQRLVVAADALLDTRLEGRDRIKPMVESVLNELELQLGDRVLRESRLRVLLSLPEARPGFLESDAAWIVEAIETRWHEKNSRASVRLVGRGHAGAILALEQASQECARHSDAVCLVVGAESYHHPSTFIWLERERRFAQPGIRSGFTPGEGAGGLALVSPGLRRRLGLPSLAIVRGVRTAQETQLRTSETGSFGEGMTQAVLGTLAGLKLPQEAVDTVYADLNGERYRSEEWAFTMLRAPTAWKTPGYRAPSDCWGDVGAAFGTLAAILAVRAFARGYAQGPRALVIAGSDSGLRGAMLLQPPSTA